MLSSRGIAADDMSRSMDLGRFLADRRPKWERLAALLTRIEMEGLGRLPLEEAREFGQLYRTASSDLLWARSQRARAELVDYLNGLVSRAYAQTYPGERPRL